MMSHQDQPKGGTVVTAKDQRLTQPPIHWNRLKVKGHYSGTVCSRRKERWVSRVLRWNSGHQWVIRGRKCQVICKAVNAVSERREKEHVFTPILADAHRHLRYYTAQDHPEGLHSEQANGCLRTVVNTEAALLAVLCAFEPLAGLTSSKLHWNKNKNKTNRSLWGSLFLWESLSLGTASGELIVNLITQEAWFPMKRRLLFTEWEGQSRS